MQIVSPSRHTHTHTHFLIKHGRVLADGWANGDCLSIYWGLMLLWVVDVGFENTCAVLGKLWCKPRELGDRVSSRFPCVNPLMEASPHTFCKLQWIILKSPIYNPVKHSRSSSSAKIANSLKTSTISAKKLYRRSSTGFQMRLQLERCCKYGGISRLQVRVICSHRLARRVAVETWSNQKRTWHVW